MLNLCECDSLAVQEIIEEIEPDLTAVELDMIIEEIDEEHTGRVTFERKDWRVIEQIKVIIAFLSVKVHLQLHQTSTAKRNLLH